MTTMTWADLTGDNMQAFGNKGLLEYQAIVEALSVTPQDTVKLYLNGSNDEKADKVLPDERRVPKKGIAVYIDLFDESAAVFKDGQPVAATHTTTRGRYYHSGLYVHKDNHYHCTNVRTPKNQWQEGSSPESQYAQAFLLGGK